MSEGKPDQRHPPPPPLSQQQQDRGVAKRIVQLEDQLHEMEVRLSRAEKDRQHIQKAYQKEKQEKSEILTRLSEVAAKQMTQNNPDIANLADPNRPTKLGEAYGQLYDDEWTNAYEMMVDNGQTELKDVWKFCLKKRENKIKMIEDIFASEDFILVEKPKEQEIQEYFECLINRFVRLDADSWHCQKDESNEHVLAWSEKTTPEGFVLLKTKEKGARESSSAVATRSGVDQSETRSVKPDGSVLKNEVLAFLKTVACRSIDILTQTYVSSCSTPDEDGTITTFKRQCVRICWLMCVQTPPMSLHSPVNHKFSGDNSAGNRVDNCDKDLYRPYTRSGTILDYIVWPPLLLYDQGPVVVKGVAQMKKI